MPEQNALPKKLSKKRTPHNPAYKPPSLPRKEELFPSDEEDGTQKDQPQEDTQHHQSQEDEQHDALASQLQQQQQCIGSIHLPGQPKGDRFVVCNCDGPRRSE